LGLLKEVLVLTQDANMDNVDLQVWEAAEAKWVRRSIWVDQTKWAASLKGAIKQFPVMGMGHYVVPC
jgi:hypothetical protein